MSTLSSRDKELVYGDSGNERLVFMQRDLADLYLALVISKTWGEFESSVSAHVYQEIIEDIREDEDRTIPLPEDVFNPYDISGYDTCEWPTYPLQAMLEWMPTDVRERYGEVSDTMFDGPQLIFDPDDKGAVVDALEKHGYTCIENTFLIQRAMRTA